MFENTRREIFAELKSVRDAAVARGELARTTYADTLEKYQSGIFTCGFMWDLAKHDDVFASFLTKRGVPRQ